MGAPKKKWIAEEEAGIAKHGIGKWSTIIKDPEFSTPMHLRTNVDLKDKWRNMNVVTSGLSRQMCKPVTSNTQVSPMVCDESGTLNTVQSGVEIICDAKPLATICENFPNYGSERPITRSITSMHMQLQLYLHNWYINIRGFVVIFLVFTLFSGHQDSQGNLFQGRA